jgi:hypothetical protein
MVEIESTTVKLGEKEYTIRQAGFLRSRPWKKRLLDEVKPLFEGVTGAGDIVFNSASDILKLLPMAQSMFVEIPETLLDLLFAYAPELEADRALIEAHATDKQIFAAFQEVVKLADFLGVTSLLTRRIGRSMTGIS